MSQNDDQNRDRKNQGEGYQDSNSDQSTREGRTGSSSDRERQQNQGETRPDQAPDLDDTEEMDDEDRDDDQRTEGGANRRRSIS